MTDIPSDHITNDLFSYVETLSRPSILELYSDGVRGQYMAKTILQKLPELARQFTIRLSVCGGSFPYQQVQSWSSSRHKNDVKSALERMQALAVIEPVKKVTTQDDFEGIEIDLASIIQLSKPFQNALQLALSSFSPGPYPELSQEELDRCISTEKTNPTPNEKVKYPTTVPSLAELERFTQSRWDSVLHFLVGTDDPGVESPPVAIISFLQETGLMQEDPDFRGSHEAPLVITSRGYEFMLQDVHVQVWQFILKYIQKLGASGQNEQFRKEALLFLICLSYCKVGTAYKVSALSKDTKKIMKDFSLFGLLYICQVGGVKLFFPTRVAVNLIVGGLSDVSSSKSKSDSTSVAALSSSAASTKVLEMALDEPIPSKNHIAIICQTNFQVCAYTTSSLHVSMLGLFCDLSSFRRLPNVIFFRITRDSIKGAFKLGIEARQILRFLKMHAHPKLRTGDQPLIPSNIEDQIILWDRELSRVKMDEVYILQCQNDDEYEAVKFYVLSIKAFGWGSEKERRIMVHYDKASDATSFVRRYRTRMAMHTD